MAEKTFSQTIGSTMIEAMETLYQREQDDPNFLSQEDYPDCESRALAWLDMAYAIARPKMGRDAGYVIAVHREDSHKDDTLSEQAILLEAGADKTLVTSEDAKAWWNGG